MPRASLKTSVAVGEALRQARRSLKGMTSWTMCEVRAREVERRASGVARPRATWWESWWHVHEPGQPDEEKFFGSPCQIFRIPLPHAVRCG